jgi:uncharacterized membrane protein YgcG
VSDGVDAVEMGRTRLTDAGRWLFGDRLGLALWLALLLWLGLTWRIGFFIQDTYATANTLVALSNGQLQVTELRYSITFASQPGLHQYDGALYGRNYGQLVFAVPFVWALETLSVAVDPRLLLAGLWAGVGLALVGTASELVPFDGRRTRTAGAVVVTVVFLASVATATNLPRARLALVAYQLSTMVAAATAALVVYRLLWALQDRRLGLVAGVALGVATPVGFWATLPKRHTLVATLVLGAVYAFAVSRQREGWAALRARAGAYALAGLITWTHAFEALFVVSVLGVVDLATARPNGLRQLAVVALALSVAITPMAATNYAISGNPAEPPRLLPAVGTDVEFAPSPAVPDGGGSAGGTGSGEAGGGAGGTGDGGTSDGGGGLPVPDIVGVVQGAVGTISTFAGGEAVAGVRALDDTDRLWHTFVRSGTVPSVGYEPNDYEPIDLALLEAMPLLGALLALPALLGRRLRRFGERSLGEFDPRKLTPARQTDLLVATLAVVLTIIYLPRLPLYSMLTVRYIHPVVPLALYGICRIPVVGGATTDLRWLGTAYLGSLAVALVVLLGGITGLGLAVGEAVQYNALWNLAAATLCAGVVLGRTVWSDRVSARAVAVGLAVPAGFITAYLLLSGLVYFRYGSYAFDVVRVVAEFLPAL